MERKMWVVDAFTSTPFQGNPAGVILDAEGLTASQMQAIANEIHASETAFVFPSDETTKYDFHFRYFTPSAEVDLCGHATIATVCSLLRSNRIVLDMSGEGSCRILTNVGVLPIRFGRQNGIEWAEMGQATPQFRDFKVNKVMISQLLGLKEVDIDDSLPCGISYTGLWDVFVPLKNLDSMKRIKPNLSGIQSWNEAIGVVSTHVYSQITVEQENHYHTRDFSPVVGIPEDPATGTATGALLALLYLHDHVEQDVEYRFEQGYEISRESVVSARIVNSSTGSNVYVKGFSTVSMSGLLYI